MTQTEGKKKDFWSLLMWEPFLDLPKKVSNKLKHSAHRALCIPFGKSHLVPEGRFPQSSVIVLKGGLQTRPMTEKGRVPTTWDSWSCKSLNQWRAKKSKHAYMDILSARTKNFVDILMPIYCCRCSCVVVVVVPWQFSFRVRVLLYFCPPVL